MLNDDDKYEVLNYGYAGYTMMKTGDLSYWKVLKPVLSSNVDIIVLMLGTNDAKSY